MFMVVDRRYLSRVPSSATISHLKLGLDELQDLAGAHTFAQRSNKMTSKKIGSFHGAVGRFVTTWASLEVGLDLLVIILSRNSETKKVPHGLFDKIKFVQGKAPFKSQSHNAEIARLLGEITSLADTRHEYVHGAVFGHILDRSILTITLARLLQPNKQTGRRRRVKVTVSQINEASARVDDIGGKLLDMAELLNRETTT